MSLHSSLKVCTIHHGLHSLITVGLPFLINAEKKSFINIIDEHSLVDESNAMHRVDYRCIYMSRPDH